MRAKDDHTWLLDEVQGLREKRVLSVLSARAAALVVTVHAMKSSAMMFTFLGHWACSLSYCHVR